MARPKSPVPLDRTSINLPENLRAHLDRVASEEGVSLSTLIVRYLSRMASGGAELDLLDRMMMQLSGQASELAAIRAQLAELDQKLEAVIALSGGEILPPLITGSSTTEPLAAPVPAPMIANLDERMDTAKCAHGIRFDAEEGCPECLATF